MLMSPCCFMSVIIHIGLLDDWLSAIRNQTLFGVVMFDLSKAFDVVHQRLILGENSSANAACCFLLWIKSYRIAIGHK